MPKTAIGIILALLWGWKRIIDNPVYGLYAFVFVISVQPQQTYAWIPLIYWLHLPLLMGLLTLVGYSRRRAANRKPAVSNPHNALMLAFFAIILLSAIYNGINPWQSKMVQEFTRSMALYFLLVNLVDSEEKFVQMIWVWVGTYAYMAFLGMDNHETGKFVNCKPFEWSHKNLWGMEVCETMPLAAGLVWNVYEPLLRNRIAMKWLALIPLSLVRIFWRHETWASVLVLGIAGILFFSQPSESNERKLRLCWRAVAGMATLAMIVNAMWCHSRSAYLATLVCIGLIVLYELRRMGRSTLIVLVLVAVSSYVGRERIVNTYNNIVVAPKTDGSAQERIEKWHLAMRWMSENPALGIGPEQFIARTQGNRAAHNGFAQVGAELGLTGLIIWVGMGLLTLVRGVSNLIMVRRLPQIHTMGELSVYLGIAYIAWAFSSFFQGFIYYHHVYMIMGLTVAAQTIIRRHLQQEEVRQRQRMMSLPRVAPAPVLRSPA